MDPLVAVYDACVLYPNFLVRLEINGGAKSPSAFLLKAYC